MPVATPNLAEVIERARREKWTRLALLVIHGQKADPDERKTEKIRIDTWSIPSRHLLLLGGLAGAIILEIRLLDNVYLSVPAVIATVIFTVIAFALMVTGLRRDVVPVEDVETDLGSR
jgi:hypothetical protein